jgi:hypothetical protein
MSNKLPWFPHEHDARNDGFISEAEDRFGHFGYSAWFKLLELVHEHGKREILTMSVKRVGRELRSRPGVVRQFLDFSQGSRKLIWKEDGQVLTIKIEKVLNKWRHLRNPANSTYSQTTAKIQLERDRDKERERDKDIDKGIAVKRFKQPTLEEVKAYCLERKNSVDAVAWLAFYESNGWRVGRNPMKKWKAAVVTWEKSNFGGSKSGQTEKGSAGYIPGKYAS